MKKFTTYDDDGRQVMAIAHKNGIETIYISSMNNIHDITFNVFTEKKYVDKTHKMEIYHNDIYFNSELSAISQFSSSVFMV